MTQFALVKMAANCSTELLRHLTPCPSSGLIRDASRRIFEGSERVYVLEPLGQPFDDLYLDAQRKMSGGAAADDTGLFKALNDVRIGAEAIALWYGDEFFDLRLTSSWSEFRSTLMQDLKLPPFETYLLLRQAPGQPASAE